MYVYSLPGGNVPAESEAIFVFHSSGNKSNVFALSFQYCSQEIKNV